MPYVDQRLQNHLDPSIHLLVKALRSLPTDMGGPLNYAITRLLLETLPADYRYTDLRDAIAALEMAKLEFYRKKVSPYEDAKAILNGDVYE